MYNKEEALRQINDIYAVVQNNLTAVISGPLMIATGLGIMAIPVFEWFFNQAVDPFLINVSQAAVVSDILSFILRTIFYWIMFSKMGNYFNYRTKKNLLLEKIFKGIRRVFPFIVLATAIMLAITKNSILIAPIILILIGCLFLFFGQFGLPRVRLMAYNLIGAGLFGIWLTTIGISHLWMYLVFYEGLSFLVLGLLLNKPNKQFFD